MHKCRLNVTFIGVKTFFTYLCRPNPLRVEPLTIFIMRISNKCIVSSLALITFVSASAEGYQINTHSAKQGGMGHTGTALKLGAESMFFNPAGLGFSQKTLDLTGSFNALKPYASARNCKSTVMGNTTEFPAKYDAHNNISTPLLIGASFRIYDNLQAGIAFYTPYGSSINWTNNWPGAELNQKVKLATYTIQPTFSYRISPKLSVGAGLMITWGSVDLYKGLISGTTFDSVLLPKLQSMGMDVTPFGTTAPATINLNGKAEVAFGFNAGVMYDVSSKVTLGANFRSRQLMKVKAGDAKVIYANKIAETALESTLGLINEANFSAAMPLPWVLTVGGSYRPTDRWTLAADVALTGWKTYKHLNIDFLDEKVAAFSQHITKDYRDAWCFRLGAQYALTHRFDLRFGMMIDTTPVDKHNYNPETPGMAKIEPSAGLSFRPIERLSIDFSLLYVAGLGAKGASITHDDLLLKSAGLPAEKTFVADYRCNAINAAIGVNYSF